MERREMNSPVVTVPTQVKRKRQRKGLTLAPATITHLEKVIESGEANNISRAIDFTTLFYTRNQKNIFARLEPTSQAEFEKLCAAKNRSPADVLASLAVQWTAKQNPPE